MGNRAHFAERINDPHVPLAPRTDELLTTSKHHSLQPLFPHLQKHSLVLVSIRTDVFVACKSALRQERCSAAKVAVTMEKHLEEQREKEGEEDKRRGSGAPRAQRAAPAQTGCRHRARLLTDPCATCFATLFHSNFSEDRADPGCCLTKH